MWDELSLHPVFQCTKLSNMTANAMTIIYFVGFTWNPPVFHSIPLWQTHNHSSGFWQPPTTSDILIGWSCLSDRQPWTISSHRLTQMPRSIHTKWYMQNQRTTKINTLGYSTQVSGPRTKVSSENSMGLLTLQWHGDQVPDSLFIPFTRSYLWHFVVPISEHSCSPLSPHSTGTTASLQNMYRTLKTLTSHNPLSSHTHWYMKVPWMADKRVKFTGSA